MPQPPQDLAAYAKQVHQQLIEATRRANRANAELAYLLLEVEQHGLWRFHGGRRSTADYAVHFGFTKSEGKARDLLTLAKNLEQRPLLRAAFKSGDADWTKAREAAKGSLADDPAKEPEWLERLLTRRYNAIEASRLEAEGQPAPVRKTLEFTREGAASLEQAVDLARELWGRRLTDSELLVLIAREWHQSRAGGSGPGSGAAPRRSSARSANRIVVNRCRDCGTAWKETRGGQVAVSAASLEEHACDAEVSDVTEGPTRITKTVPPMIRRLVLDRDGHRCRVPGCGATTYLHVHHEGGRENVGHDPDFMWPACDRHHQERHDHRLTVRLDPVVGFRFYGADDVEITGAPDDVEPLPPPPPPSPGRSRRSRERGRGGARTSAEAASDPVAEIERDALRALANLQLGPRESGRALGLARQTLHARGEEVTLPALMTEALRALPLPGAPRPDRVVVGAYTGPRGANE